MKMPGLSRKAHHPSSTSTSSSSVSSTTNDARSSIWTRSNTEDVSFGQLQKFWNELSADARRKLLRIDKQTLFEQVRKNLYCSRCHGLLVEGFSQIIMYGKSLHSAVRGNAKSRKVFPANELNGDCSTLQDDARDPSLHPWGGLAATKDCMLTVLDCFVDGTPLEVFESARGRERERELLYPDACGGNGRGWISQTSVSYASGRGHGMKETCALHTARLSCEALVDFWSALSEETRRSLLRMKEEDFIERLMFRFDSKRFCRDCRRNVLREFKEMKELKRARKEPRCTRWFCAADTSFQYEVSDSAVQADWHDSFVGEVGTLYQHFEWALGTAEGKADIFGFEDVGLSESILMDGLELGGMADCFITIRAWRRDGRCTELSVKAHGLKGELCVHRRLFVGDGIVSITEGESIQRFFEHAEETEEEEDEDGLDKDGNELDGEGPRSQKHAKSPELARDFLLDAATVIFKEQVEKAFREGTARQNAHSIFVCLALGLLEDRVRVACKEIATLEKQNKLLEEEEHEKREEEERRERRKLKEKEKKLRRKEKLKSKEREKDKGKGGKSPSTPSDRPEGELAVSSCMTEVRLVPDECESDHGSGRDCSVICSAACIEDSVSMRDGNGAFIIEQSKSAKRRSNGKRQQVVDSVPTRYARRGAVLAFERVNGRVSVDSSLQERQAAKDSHRIDGRNNISQSRQDSQQCACAATFWVKGGQQLCTGATTSKVTRRTTAVDSSSKQLHNKAAGSLKGRVIAAVTPGSVQKVSAETVSVPAPVKARTVCKGGLSYTKVVSRGWTGDERPAGLKQVQDVCSASDNGCPTSVTLPENSKEHANVDSQWVNGELEKTLEVEAVVDEILSDRQPELSASILELPLTDEDGHTSTTANCKVGNEILDSEVDGHCHSPSNRGFPVEEEADSRRSESSTVPVQSSPTSSMPAPATGNLYGMGSHAPVCTPDVGRNGFANGFVHGGQAGGKNPYAVMEMLPVPGQIRHPVHMHPPQPGFGCYPVHHGPPWGPHQQPRNSFMPPPSAPAAAGFLIHGPAFGYPRYPVPRLLHPSMRMPPLLAEMGTLHMREVPPPRPGFTPWQAAASGAVDTTRSASSCVLPPRAPGLPPPAEMGETPAFSLQQGDCGADKQLHVLSDSSGFSLFHFSVPASNGVVSTEFDSPTSAVSSEANEEEVVPEVSSKCMDRPPSGINKLSTGEYSLFAAAPGKAFGFF